MSGEELKQHIARMGEGQRTVLRHMANGLWLNCMPRGRGQRQCSVGDRYMRIPLKTSLYVSLRSRDWLFDRHETKIEEGLLVTYTLKLTYVEAIKILIS